jgi:HK97 family phage prohead protease
LCDTYTLEFSQLNFLGTTMDRLFCSFEIKSQHGDEDGIITGYGSVFGNVDSYGDTVAKGAFKKTIADAKTGASQWPAMLLQHGDATAEGKMPVGIWLDMSEDERGLKLKGKLATNTKRGADAYALLKMAPRPALDGLSIGYRAKDYELHKAGTGPNGARRTLKSVDLVEVSLVTFPADSRARVTGVKSYSEPEPEPMDENAWKKYAWEDFEKLRRFAEGR